MRGRSRIVSDLLPGTWTTHCGKIPSLIGPASGEQVIVGRAPNVELLGARKSRLIRLNRFLLSCAASGRTRFLVTRPCAVPIVVADSHAYMFAADSLDAFALHPFPALDPVAVLVLRPRATFRCVQTSQPNLAIGHLNPVAVVTYALLEEMSLGLAL